MQMFAEIYLLLEGPGGMSPADIAERLAGWKNGLTASYLLEVTETVLAGIDKETGKPLVEIIRDRAAHKGTGQWTVEAGLDLGIAVPGIAAAFEARVLSSRRTDKANWLPKALPEGEYGVTLAEDLRAAMPLAMLASYAQGLALIAEASRIHGWGTELASVARAWREGCIIRAALLEPIAAALDSGTDDLMATSFAAELLASGEAPLRRLACKGIAAGIPIPVFASVITYLDGLAAPCVGANLIQGQRDFFGAHTFERVDRPGSFRHDWRNNQ
jgi:6-phosphogluconate dehydrogenase